MDSKGVGKILMISVLWTVLVVSQSLFTLTKARNLEQAFADQKNYYSPDPHTPISPPPHASISPPSHPHRSPSCPPPPPPPHREGGCSCAPPTVGPISPLPPTIPVGPPAPIIISPTPTTPSVPSHSPPFIPAGPPTPVTIPPAPTTPSTPSPSTPFIPVDPSPPSIPVDPNAPPFTPSPTPGSSIYWSRNPTLIWGIFGYWATIGGLFGPVTTLPFGRNLSVQQALANTRSDGYGALYREATASYLNSLVMLNKFPFSTPEVRRAFASSLVSEKAAARQARLFKLANEGRLIKKH